VPHALILALRYIFNDSRKEGAKLQTWLMLCGVDDLHEDWPCAMDNYDYYPCAQDKAETSWLDFIST
jgi:hypothetical protein